MVSHNFDLYKAKYLKYKTKYLTLQNILGGTVRKASKLNLFNNEKISDVDYYYINKDKIKSEIRKVRIERKIPFTLAEMETRINKNHVNREVVIHEIVKQEEDRYIKEQIDKNPKKLEEMDQKGYNEIISKFVKEEADEKIKETALLPEQKAKQKAELESRFIKIKEEINLKKKTEENHTNEKISNVDYYYTNKYIIKSVIRDIRKKNKNRSRHHQENIEDLCNNLYPNRKAIIRKIINEDMVLYNKLLEELIKKQEEQKQKILIEKKQKEEMKKKQKEEREKNNVYINDDDDIDFDEIEEINTNWVYLNNKREDQITIQMNKQDEQDKITETKVSQKQKKELEDIFKEIEKQLSSEEKLAKEKLAKMTKEESEKKAKLTKEESEKKTKMTKEQESICKKHVEDKKLNPKDLNALKNQVLKKLKENYSETELNIKDITDIDICDFDKGLLEPIQIEQEEEPWLIPGAIPF